MFQLNNAWMNFSVSQRSGGFSIYPSDPDLLQLDDVHMSISGHSAKGRFVCPLGLDPDSAQKKKVFISYPAHIQDQFIFQASSTQKEIACKVLFSFSREIPSMMWKVVITNRASQAVWIERIDLLKSQKGMNKPGLRMNEPVQELDIFVSGWQSWSFAGLTNSTSPQMRSHLGFLQNPMIVDAGLEHGNRYRAVSDMYAVMMNREKEKGILLGFLSQREQFGHIAVTKGKTADIRMWAEADGVLLKPGTTLQTDWAVYMQLEGAESEVIAPYLEMVSRENKISHSKHVPLGWCSWYQYYQDINEEIIQENLNVLVEHQDDFPLELVQIDDGYQKQVGDWLSFRPGFSRGMQPVASEIKRKGFTPGLWLAPFIVHRGSDLYREHPEWILRKANGKPVNAGFVWNSLGTALDVTQPDAMAYVEEVIHTAVRDWEFPYLKLDFLYAAALEGQYHDPTKTRAQVLRTGLENIRKAAGKQTYLVGCGLPLGSALGLVDAMRIGADVSGSWKPKYFNVGFPFKHEPGMPCARNSIRNILTRANLHDRWWVNDPDCLLVREQAELSLPEVQTLATVIALSGGSMIFSDDLTALSADRFHLAACLVPPINTRMVVVDWLQNQYPRIMRVCMEGTTGEWYLLAKINWSDEEELASPRCEEFGIEAGKYWVSDFWGGNISRNESPQTLGEYCIPAHGCLLLAVRGVQENKIQYIGSDLHFSQGNEIKKWVSRKKGVRFSVDANKKTSGRIYLAIPNPSAFLEFSDDIANFEKVSPGIFALHMALDKKLEVAIRV